jgi:phage shock protein PspC (stress-responsive transcriptional regulator)
MHAHRNVFTRPDTLLGVCQALGEDFRFNPNILRIAFGVPLVWSPFVVIAAYLSLGIVVLATRMLLPNPMPASQPTQLVDTEDAETAHALEEPLETEQRERELALAA